jgi:RNA polymerase sigma factor (sigma-70 family)
MADGRLRTVINQLRRLMGRQTGCALTDSQLLENYTARRDDASFEVLVWRHGTMVLSLCQRVLRDSHDAEDAFQATFLVFARKAGSIGKRDAVASWLYKVAYRIALRLRARTVKQHEREEPADDLPDRSNCEEEVVWRDLRPVLDQEIDRLPAKYRTPFVLCYLQGYTNEEAAEQLHCPKGTILSRLARGRERLRSRLTGRGLALSAGLFTGAFLQNASAAVPAALVDSTVKAAIPFAAGKAATGLVSAAVVALSEGALRTMYWNKLKIAAAALVALAILGTGVGSMAHWALADRPRAAGQEAGDRGGDAGRRDARPDDQAMLIAGRVVAVGKDGKSFVLEVPSQERGERGAEPKKVDVKIADKTVVTYAGVGPDGAKPTEGYAAQVRLENGNTAASVAFRGTAGTRNPDVSGKVTAVAADGKGITVEVSPARGRGDDVQPAKTVDIKFNDKTVVIYSAVAKDGAKLTPDYRASVWLEDGPKGSSAASVHLFGNDQVVEGRDGPPADVSGRVVAVANDGKTITLEQSPQNRGDEPKRIDIKLGDKTTVAYQNVTADGTKVAEGFQARIWLENGSKDQAGKAVFAGVPKERWPVVAGTVVAAGKDGKTFTLEQPARTRAEEPKRIEVTLTDKTRTAYSGVGPDGAKPTEGYRVQVWLEDESNGRAVAVEFAKPGSGDGRR